MNKEATAEEINGYADEAINALQKLWQNMNSGRAANELKMAFVYVRQAKATELAERRGGA